MYLTLNFPYYWQVMLLPYICHKEKKILNTSGGNNCQPCIEASEHGTFSKMEFIWDHKEVLTKSKLLKSFSMLFNTSGFSYTLVRKR